MTAPNSPGLPPELLEDLFRRRYAQLVQSLVRAIGPSRLELAEDVVQDAMLRALRRWPADGVPDDPAGWVFRVARNLAIDALRRQHTGRLAHAALAAMAPSTAASKQHTASDGEDDTLRMMFLCAHPRVPASSRVPFLLKHVCGFGVPAIARVLLQKEATVAQQLVRAKAKLQRKDVGYEQPSGEERDHRVATVSQAIYFMFTEGYRAHAGEDLVRSEVVEEAVRLCSLLSDDKAAPKQKATQQPAQHALLALMLLLGARLDARTDAAGELVPLAQQDRSRWRTTWLQCGFYHLRQSLDTDVMTPWHCEARIASLHAAAPDYATTDWPAILLEYDRLEDMRPTPIVRLNRAIAMAKVHGPAKALATLAHLSNDRTLENYYLLDAVRGHLHWQLGDVAHALAAMRSALTHRCTDPERRLLERRIEALQSGARPEAW